MVPQVFRFVKLGLLTEALAGLLEDRVCCKLSCSSSLSSSSLGVKGDEGAISIGSNGPSLSSKLEESSNETLIEPSALCVKCKEDRISHVIVVGVNGDSSDRFLSFNLE